MLIPNAENAVVELRKLRDYCLNAEHSTGKHKGDASHLARQGGLSR